VQVSSTISLKAEEVAKIIADYINSNFTIDTPITAQAVKFSVSAGYQDGPMYSSAGLTSAEVKVVLATKPQHIPL
jgi:hypothetical protein